MLTVDCVLARYTSVTRVSSGQSNVHNGTSPEGVRRGLTERRKMLARRGLVLSAAQPPVCRVIWPPPAPRCLILSAVTGLPGLRTTWTLIFVIFFPFKNDPS